ncbi:MAG: hypothetical protein K2O18_01450 [Oscillospiraceae bacterium]|nr:hypothetical protein [Oscillospiraceae bacterium]
MLNSTMKSSGKLDKGIIATPDESFFKGTRNPSRFQQKYVTGKMPDAQSFQKAETQAGVKEADSYDDSFDEMPV